jgi:hypothetical protein
MYRRSLASVAFAIGLALVVAGAPTTTASSHREAPLTAADPQNDATDLYAFVSPDAPDTVTLISNWIPFQEPAGGPNFYPWADGTNYEIKIDNDGNAVPDIVYRWEFTSSYKNSDTFLYNLGPVNSLTDPNLNFTQTYRLTRIAGGRNEVLVDNAIAAPSHVGAASMPNYQRLRDEAIVDLRGRPGKSFVGQADDPFFLDLRVFDLLYGTNLKEVGADTLTRFNVNTLALQVPKNDLAQQNDAGRNPIIGVWTTAERPSMQVRANDGSQRLTGGMVQVSRLGMPLVNEVVVPVASKNLFNASSPNGDARFLAKVQDPELPKLLQKIYNIAPPATPRADLVSVFLTGVDGLNKPANVTPSEQLRLNMSMAPNPTPNRLGVLADDKAGFPNGRRLTDDVVDIELRVVAGALTGARTDLGDAVDANDMAFGPTFPYIPLPHSGSEPRPGTLKAAAAANQQADGDGGAAQGSDQAGATDDDGLPVVGLVAGGVGIVVLAAVAVALLARRRRRTA